MPLMSSTCRWLTVSQTVTRIWNETGRLLAEKDVMGLDGQRGGLVVNSTHDHVRISEESIDAYVARYGRRTGIPVGEGPDIGYAAEDEFRASQDDYTDTPNDEGDDDQ
jgi:hypothetical protein